MKHLLTTLPLALGLLAAGCTTADDGGGEYFGMPGYAGNDGMAGGGYDGSWPGAQGGDQFTQFTDNPFVATQAQPVSTFSVDADGASYGIVRRYLNSHIGYFDPSAVRIEELLNYFTFDYAEPTDGQTVAINAEVSACPWNDEHRLLRLGLKGKSLTEAETPRANFVFLVDVSGSMADSDRLDLFKAGLTELLNHLRPTDRISLITYSGEVKKLLESTPVSEASKIKKAIGKLNASGCTAGGQALKMAYEEALANYDPVANNRVIMGTDGDFNVGVTSTEALVEMVETYASRGIYMTCLGFGLGNLNDAMMEKISNAGNGAYHYIDSEDEMMKVFVHERERFVSVANDTKCQLSFDSTLVSQYRLIGYENRLLNAQDFDNDAKDAGEIGAGQTVTALYELVPTERFRSLEFTAAAVHTPFVTFDVRYKKALSESSIPLQLVVSVADMTNLVGEKPHASENLLFAAGVATYGMLLRQSPYKGEATYILARELVKRGMSFDPHGYRAELLRLIELAAASQKE